jgi:hypothetical protein
LIGGERTSRPKLGLRVLAPGELSAGLAERVKQEENQGLPRTLRVAMRFDIGAVRSDF